MGGGQGLPLWEGKTDVGKFMVGEWGVCFLSHTVMFRNCSEKLLSREDPLSLSVMTVKQERSVSRAQSPPVPARKNQLRAEGRVKGKPGT